MPLRKKKNIKRNGTAGKNTNGSSYFNMSGDKKKKIIGILVILISFYLFVSILSFDRRDEALLTNLFDDISISFDTKIDTYNWLGITGAHVSKFLVKEVLGYFSISIPFLLFLFGILFFRKINFRLFIHLSNFTLLSSFIIASFFGVLRTNYDVFSSTLELAGGIGDILGNFLAGILGGIGSVLLLITSFIVLMIISFDIKFENIFSFIKGLFVSSVDKVKDEWENSGEDKNLDKIKKLGEEKKKKRKEKKSGEEITADDLMEQEEDDQTKITIIRKDDTPTQIPESPVIKEEVKKVDLEKTGEAAVKDEEKEKEAKLPDQWDEDISYKMPGFDLLDPIPEESYQVAEEELTHNAELLKEKLRLFDIEIKDISVTPGPVVTLYEIVPAPGVKISRIVGLENDIALALAARGIRIIAPIPGKGAIGVEIPNAKASVVNARSVLGKISESKAELPLALGKTISGDVYVTDLSKMPHLLIAGSTGSGKSVGINMIVSSLLYSKHPSEVKFIMVDPKKIELSLYNKLRRHYLAVSPDLDEEIITAPQNAVLMLKSVEYEMERRYDKLAKAGVRNIVDYNKKVSDPKTKPHDTDTIKHHPVPYLLVIIDELADLMITAGKEVEEPITRLAQLARAVGIHLVLATQRPSVNVITGVIKANFSSRIAYQVATKIDSRTILDMNGAEQLLGSGDMLFLPTGSPKPIRIQNAFISTDEVERLTNYIYSQPAYSKPYFLPSLYDKKKDAAAGYLGDLDPMFEDAARVIVRHQQGSVSLLQRRLKLGYSRAARIVDQLEEAGIVGPNDGSKARIVLVENEEQLETILRNV
ncbi:MAG: DNA translocase FtsK [Ignavibacteriaceae bacterium]|nr:DNA translocase FtsK [Ignavibacteriaceae bacterium]